jgi:asparagine synthase (glutamine-hydrolysing)
MCGIFGWFTPGRALDYASIVAGTSAIRHRGPDDEGYLLWNSGSALKGKAYGGVDTDPELTLDSVLEAPVGADFAFGFRRLSIHDLSAAGHQPMSSCDGKLWIVFNGEVYNFIELRAELENAGHRFVTGTDTEVVLRCYELWGTECFHRFNGMWGMAILDLRAEGAPQLIVTRDRCGVKSVFYSEDGAGGVCFASEMKAVLATRSGWVADEVTLTNFLAWGRLPSQREGHTFVQGVQVIPPGCYAQFVGGKMALTRYWDVPNGGADAVAPEAATSALREIFDDAVELRRRADVPLGSCLSGGVDSSVIVGAINKARRSSTDPAQHTFSAVYHTDGPFNEKRFIDRVLTSVSAEPHFVYPTAERLVNEFDRLVWHQDEPFPNTSMYAQWCVMATAREAGITVLLDGISSLSLFFPGSTTAGTVV